MRLPGLSGRSRWKVNLPTVRGRQVTWPVVGAVAAAALFLGLGAAWAFSARPGDAVAAPVPSHTVVPATSASPTATTTVTPTTAPGIRPGDIIATVKGDSIGIYAAPGDPSPSSTLSKWSAFFSPRTLLAVDTTGIGDVQWLKVDLPLNPNGQTGWIRAADVTVTSTDYAIHVFLDERILEYWEGDVMLLSVPVVVGADATPTPTGMFYVTDPLPFANANGVYGSYALGLSGFSNTLDSFNGGPPQLALHGTNNPTLLGTAASHGCVRIRNDIINQIAQTAVPGTPVYIVQSRADA